MSKKRKVSTARFLNAKITSTVSITLVLVLLGTTILIMFMGQGFSSYVKEKMSFSIMLDEAVTDAQINAMRKSLDSKPFVKSSRFISKEEAKQQIIKDLGDDPEEVLGYNPAQDCIEIFLTSEYANSDSIRVIDEQLRQENNVANLLYRQEAIDFINNNLSKLTTLLLGLATILLFISFTLIRNTIRLSVYSKRFLIHTMKLVGATGGFIRKPFVINSLYTGIIAGLLANGIIFSLITYFGKEYVRLDAILKNQDLIILFAIVIVLGVIITTIAAAFAVNRYLKMKADRLYYI